MFELQGFGDQILLGALMTLQLAAGAVAVGLVLGLLGASAKLSRSRLARAAAGLYTTVVRGVPELIIILPQAVRIGLPAYGNEGNTEPPAAIAERRSPGFRRLPARISPLHPALSFLAPSRLRVLALNQPDSDGVNLHPLFHLVGLDEAGAAVEPKRPGVILAAGVEPDPPGTRGPGQRLTEQVAAQPGADRSTARARRWCRRGSGRRERWAARAGPAPAPGAAAPAAPPPAARASPGSSPRCAAGRRGPRVRCSPSPPVAPPAGCATPSPLTYTESPRGEVPGWSDPTS
jgi:His/Glu/Gln/Arg/opine family amino acid ABC transporter permease subunit